ncbi:BTAD domain-containing putative transcriptional regulator [Rhizobium sp. 2YAF20]|uniref:AfsR/SARP family transcriptional regulator n=1 Tax=Rhizobium sp. 2YAF20 TaxID=3233027 RepID=UPI003F997634
MLDINLFGSTSFSVSGKVLRTELGQAGRLLACYLFQYSGRSHRRERLIDLFWGDLDPDRARSAFNTAIWRIRKMLDQVQPDGGACLATYGNDVRLERAPFFEVDTRKLECVNPRMLSLIKSNLTGFSEEEELCSALDCYTGPFLEGDDGDWVLQERERLHNLYILGNLELMRAFARKSDFERALAFGRQILVTDPLRESVQRDVMLLLVLTGCPADALLSYQRLRSLLKSELDIAPMPDTSQLQQEIASGCLYSDIESRICRHFGTCSVPV